MNYEILQGIILGVVQGVTEFFPISSTAHLILFPWFFGWKGEVDSLSFDIALHVGTLLAILFCFYKDWIDILLRKHRLLMLIVLATIPGAVAGKIFNHLIEKELRSPLVIAASLAGIAFYLLYAERKGRKKTTVEDMGWHEALAMGFSQAAALVPGVSRSGITIASGLVLGMKREEAARFSFLMSAPIVGGAALLHSVEIIKAGPVHLNMGLFLAGMVSSFLAGVVAIKFLLGFLKSNSLNVFVYYRFALAGFIILVLWLKGQGI